MSASTDKSQSIALRQIAQDAPEYSSYRPLDSSKREIRLMDMINESQYSLRHVNLDDQPVYCALSYYWGPPGANKPITLDGEVVEIRTTLFQFLKSLYRQFGAMTVWLDVLCINQRYFAEQNAQVAMMGDIYRKARCVYSWLGKGDPDTDYAMTVLNSGVQLNSDAYDVKRMLKGWH